jgi:hypothetical protein
MKRIVLAISVWFIFTLPLNGSDSDINLEDTINSLLANSLKMAESENVEGYLNTIHSKSQLYNIAKEQISKAIISHDMKYEIVYFKYLGKDDEYCFARIKQTTRKVSGPEFKDNELDAIVAFKMEDGKWKIWLQSILSYKFIK